MISRRDVLALMGGTGLAALSGRIASAAEPYRIGAVFPLSGPVAQLGDRCRKGIDLAIDQINADKLLSQPLEMSYEDGQNQVQTSLVAFTKLVRVSEVPVVFTVGSSVIKALAPIADRDSAVLINGAGISTELAGLAKYLFNVIPLVNFELEAMLPLLKPRGIARIAVIYMQDAIGQSIFDELQKRAADQGLEIVGGFPVAPADQQFAALAIKVRQLSPDAVFVAHNLGPPQISLIKQLRDNGITQPFLSYSVFSDPNMVALPAAQGSIFTSQRVDAAPGDTFSARFLDDFGKKYGEAPSIYSINFYNATWIAARAFRHLEEQGKPTTGANVRDAILEIGSYDGVGGRIEFRPDGTVHMPIRVNLIENEKAVPLN